MVSTRRIKGATKNDRISNKVIIVKNKTNRKIYWTETNSSKNTG